VILSGKKACNVSRISCARPARAIGTRPPVTLYDRMLKTGLFELPEAVSLKGALEWFSHPSHAPGSSARFYSAAEDVISSLDHPSVTGYPVEFSLTRVRGLDEWVATKGSEREVLFWPTRRHDYIGNFELALHNHDEDWALPSPTDLKTMVYTSSLGIKYALIGRAGLTVYSGLASLDRNGLVRFLSNGSAGSAAKKVILDPLEAKRRLLDKLISFGWIGLEYIPYSDTEGINRFFVQDSRSDA